jgi:hypothetical protein
MGGRGRKIYGPVDEYEQIVTLINLLQSPKLSTTWHTTSALILRTGDPRRLSSLSPDFVHQGVVRALGLLEYFKIIDES